MIKCIIVGKLSATKFSEYIETNSGGSAEIVKSISSIASEFENLNKEIIRVDKLVYMMSESSNVISDITALDKLLKNPTFFRVNEFFVFGLDDKDTRLGVDRLKFILNENKIENIIVKLGPELPSFTKMYSDFMGIVKNSEHSVVRKKVYLVERGDSNSKRFYDAMEDSENKIYQERDGVSEYEKVKKASEIAETRKIIKDSPEKSLPKLNIELNTIDLEAIESLKNIIVVTGKPKAGSSTLAISLVNSMVAEGKKVNLVDISSNFGSASSCIRKKGIKYNLVNNKELFTGKEIVNPGVSIFYPKMFKDSSLYPSLLKYILSIPNRAKSDFTVIDCIYTDLDEVLDICGTKVSKVFLCSQDVKDELVQIGRGINKLKGSKIFKLLVYLNNSIKFDEYHLKLLPVQASALYDGVSFIAPIDFREEQDLRVLWKEETINA